MIVFVSGGVRSGKSLAAEQMTKKYVQYQLGGRCVYFATSEITDKEMQERVTLHQREREHSHTNWVTIEASEGLSAYIGKIKHGDSVLIDCLTNWLANELFSASGQWDNVIFQQQLLESMISTIKALSENASAVVIVSNELFEGGVLEEPTYTYMRLLGNLHQQIVTLAEVAVSVQAGFHIVKKGTAAAGRDGMR